MVEFGLTCHRSSSMEELHRWRWGHGGGMMYGGAGWGGGD